MYHDLVFGYLVTFRSGRIKEVWGFNTMDSAIDAAENRVKKDRTDRIKEITFGSQTIG